MAAAVRSGTAVQAGVTAALANRQDGFVAPTEES